MMTMRFLTIQLSVNGLKKVLMMEKPMKTPISLMRTGQVLHYGMGRMEIVSIMFTLNPC